MSATVGFYNLKLPVLDLKASITFYRLVFSELGFGTGRLYDDPIDGQSTFVIGNGNFYFELVEAPQLVVKNTWPGISGPRIVLLAEDRNRVELFYEHLRKLNLDIILPPTDIFQEILNGPEDPWYATYFCDPSGHKIGVVYTRK